MEDATEGDKGLAGASTAEEVVTVGDEGPTVEEKCEGEVPLADLAEEEEHGCEAEEVLLNKVGLMILLSIARTVHWTSLSVKPHCLPSSSNFFVKSLIFSFLVSQP